MHLPEDESTAVSYLIDFLYRGPGPKSGATTEDLLSSFFLAEKICLQEMIDHIMDQIISLAKERKKIFAPAQIIETYRNTSQGSKLRLYCAASLAIFCARFPEVQTPEWKAEWTGVTETFPEFWVDIFHVRSKHGRNIYKAFATAKASDIFTVKGFKLCDFHVHGSGQPCHSALEN